MNVFSTQLVFCPGAIVSRLGSAQAGGANLLSNDHTPAEKYRGLSFADSSSRRTVAFEREAGMEGRREEKSCRISSESKGTWTRLEVIKSTRRAGRTTADKI